jgi:hypothetical protein
MPQRIPAKNNAQKIRHIAPGQPFRPRLRIADSLDGHCLTLAAKRRPKICVPVIPLQRICRDG